MSIDLLLKFSLFHITANIKQDNRMLLALLKVKCRIMPVYYLEQPCKLSCNESYTWGNIHILNLTCSPDTTGKKIALSWFPLVYVFFLPIFFCLPLKSFWLIWKKVFTIRWPQKSKGQLLNVPHMGEIFGILSDIKSCVGDRWWLLGFVFCHHIQ